MIAGDNVTAGTITARAMDCWDAVAHDGLQSCRCPRLFAHQPRRARVGATPVESTGPVGQHVHLLACGESCEYRLRIRAPSSAGVPAYTPIPEPSRPDEARGPGRIGREGLRLVEEPGGLEVVMQRRFVGTAQTQGDEETHPPGCEPGERAPRELGTVVVCEAA